MSDILVFGYNKWNFSRQSNELAEYLSGDHRILFIECQSRYSDYGIKRLGDYIKAFYPQKPKVIKTNLTIWNPPPMLPMEWVKKLTCSNYIMEAFLFITKILELTCLKAVLNNCQMTPKAIFIYDSHDLVHLKYYKDIVSIYRVYDEIDKFPVNAAIKEALPVLEKKVVGLANYVLASSYSQYQKRVTWNKNTIFFPNASSYELFNKAVSTTFEKPPELKHLKGPIVGSIGVFDGRLDIKLIKEVCAKCTDINFVFMGPIKEYMEDITEELTKLPNVLFIPFKIQKEQLPFLQHCDAMWIPYIVNDATNTMLPVKLQEYFSAGKPVISTPLNEITRLRELVFTASDAKSMSEIIKKTIGLQKNLELTQKRISYAKENSQEKQLTYILSVLQESIK